MIILALLAVSILQLTISYNIDWSVSYVYFMGGTRNPYLVDLRGTDPEFLLICFEELRDDDYAGICKTATLDLTNQRIFFHPSEIFQAQNASNPNEIQIYKNGPTEYFLLAYTNGPTHSSGPGQILLGSYGTNGAINYGEQYTFNPALNDQSRLIELRSPDMNYFIICASVGPNNQYDTACRVGEYDTDSFAISLGSKIFNMTLNHPTKAMAVSRVASDVFIACFAAYLQQFGVCYVGTVVNDFNDGLESEVEFGNEVIFHNEFAIDEIKIVHANSTVLIICYSMHQTFGDGGAGVCQFGVIRQLIGTQRYTVEFLPETFTFADKEDESISVFQVQPNSLVPDYNNPELLGVCYVDNRVGKCRFGEVDLEAMKINFEDGETNAFDESGVGDTTTVYLGGGRNNDEANFLVVCYQDFSGSTPLFNRGLCKLGTITETMTYKK